MRTPILISLLAATAANAACAPQKGDRNITKFQLYPENIDVDTKSGLAYISVLYNSEVAVYDPAQGEVVDTIKFENLSFENPKKSRPDLHASGVQVDHLQRLSVSVNAGAAFDTQGTNTTGDNFLVKYGLKEKRELWRMNLTPVAEGFAGYQDIEHDSCGNSFVVGTFPGSIIRVNFNGTKATPWYLTEKRKSSTQGLTGLAVKDGMLFASDEVGGKLLRFDDMHAEKGVPVEVPIHGADGKTSIGKGLDGIYFPPLFEGKVLLVSNSMNGTVVLRSKDGTWKSAENLGLIHNPQTEPQHGGFTTASVQMGKRIYALTEYFADAAPPNKPVCGTLAGNRTVFPLQDITDLVTKLVT
ncbi:hypothetical protein QQS21_004661 [Conoideocrella luteorostrata]|uniref:TRI14-like protein n=1 Tax=Conoideocrella luteorostrata TaxID=1105319 RepID=A0AAJ0CQX8_9HYPO|nr:hypothetical protein QQS21_004661 [Conoideocrella luteorostrata]